eukprot:753433-Hanusia_phi.AAC.1
METQANSSHHVPSNVLKVSIGVPVAAYQLVPPALKIYRPPNVAQQLNNPHPPSFPSTETLIRPSWSVW